MDPNVFAWVLPSGNVVNALNAIRTGGNRHFYVPAANSAEDRSSRESTPNIPTDEDEEREERDVEITDRLELRFDGDLKDPAEGWQFGYSSRTSDVVICRPGTPWVSRSHLALCITPDSRIQLRQRTTQTTRVWLVFRLGRFRRELRHELQPHLGDSFIVWLAPWETQYWHHIRIEVSSGSRAATFEIIFPNHTRNASQEYHDNLRQWMHNRTSMPAPLGGLGLDSVASTVAPSRQSPSPAPAFSSLCYRRKIGSGTYGEVELLVDLTTGAVAARKRFFSLSALANQKDENAAPEWDSAMARVWNEVRLMQRNPHRHIVRMLAFQESPVPSILMPYYEHGNVENMRLQPGQYRSAFRQLLVVLEYLHGRNVAHRDLKPENMLVESLDPLRIVVSDFGLSREAVPGTLMTTFCGTRLYGAPDVFPSHRRQQSAQGYWVSVDIWSAGAIMLEWTFGRPSTRNMGRTPLDTWIRFWSRTLLDEVRRRDAENPGDPVIDIVKRMLVLDPGARFQAHECLQQGCANGLFKMARNGDVLDPEDDDPDDARAATPTPTPAAQTRRLDDEGESASAADTHELWTSAAETRELCDGDADRLGGASTWQKFLDFDFLPPYSDAEEAGEAPVSSPAPQDASDASDEFVSAVEEMPSSSSWPQQRPAAVPPLATGPEGGAKRRRHGDFTPTATSSTSSAEAAAPAKKKNKQKPPVGYDSAVWSDVLGSKPRLRGAPSEQQPSSSTSGSMSVIDFSREVGQAAEAPTLTSSMSLLEGASSSSVQMA